MRTRAFRYEFTMKELGYYLFAKKECPKCGNKMKKSKSCELVDGQTISTISMKI